jgi:hypothetical protein
MKNVDWTKRPGLIIRARACQRIRKTAGKFLEVKFPRPVQESLEKTIKQKASNITLLSKLVRQIVPPARGCRW